jgi:hypothetical protein
MSQVSKPESAIALSTSNPWLLMLLPMRLSILGPKAWSLFHPLLAIPATIAPESRPTATWQLPTFPRAPEYYLCAPTLCLPLSDEAHIVHYEDLPRAPDRLGDTRDEVPLHILELPRTLPHEPLYPVLVDTHVVGVLCMFFRFPGQKSPSE